MQTLRDYAARRSADNTDHDTRIRQLIEHTRHISEQRLIVVSLRAFPKQSGLFFARDSDTELLVPLRHRNNESPARLFKARRRNTERIKDRTCSFVPHPLVINDGPVPIENHRPNHVAPP